MGAPAVQTRLVVWTRQVVDGDFDPGEVETGVEVDMLDTGLKSTVTEK